MSADIRLDGAMIGISSSLLHGLRRLLTETLGDEADVRLQEAGYAAGEQVYHAFCQWLPQYTGVDDPKDLDAATLEEVLSQFFETLGWGRLHVDRAGKSALAISSANWVEAAGDESDDPSKHSILVENVGRRYSVELAQIIRRLRPVHHDDFGSEVVARGIPPGEL